MNVTLFVKKMLAEVIKLKTLRDHLGLFGWALNTMTDVLIRDIQRGDTQRKKRRPGQDGGRDWSQAATSQGNTWSLQKLEVAGRIVH